MPNLAFRGMILAFKLRDWWLPREEILKEIGLQPGYAVLDFGCGPGSYAFIVAETVGESGKVYALDLHPLAVQRVETIAANRGLTNVKVIHSDRATDRPDESVDVVLLYDIIHMLGDSDAVLEELHRVLKPGGLLCQRPPYERARYHRPDCSAGAVSTLREAQPDIQLCQGPVDR